MSAYDTFKQAQALLEANVTATAIALRAIPGAGSGSMGLTPDAVKASPEYRSAKAAYDAAFHALREFNGKWVNVFAAEIKAERAARYKEQP